MAAAALGPPKFHQQARHEALRSLPLGSLLGLHIPLHLTSNTEAHEEDGNKQPTTCIIVKVKLSEKSRVVLSNVCLDVSECRFEQVKLLFRCTPIDNDQGGNDGNEMEAPWLCLCNYLSQEKGGAGLSPNTPLKLEVMGPCMTEWKAIGTYHPSSNSSSLVGGVDVFGTITPSADFGSEETGGVLVTRLGDAAVEDANAVEESKVGASNDRNNQESNQKSSTKISFTKMDDENSKNIKEQSKPKKRKLNPQGENQQDEPTAVTTKATVPLQLEKNNGNKLTKNQRKKLARQKAQQLEEALKAARLEDSSPTNNTSYDSISNEKQSKKEKTDASTQPTSTTTSTDTKCNSSKPQSKPTSLTRERRLPGGILLRDILIGTGTPITSGRRVTLHYTASLHSTGKVFDKNYSKTHPLVFRQGTGEVIRGLERGLEGMKVGGERVLTVPSKLAYGETGMGETVPPNSDLVFEVKVVKVG